MFEIRATQCKANEVVKVQGRPLFDYANFIRLFVGRFLADVTYTRINGDRYDLRWCVVGKVTDTLFDKEVAVREVSALRNRLYYAVRLINRVKSIRGLLLCYHSKDLLTAEILSSFALPENVRTSVLFTMEGRLILINWGLKPLLTNSCAEAADTTLLDKQRVDAFLNKVCEIYSIELDEPRVPIRVAEFVRYREEKSGTLNHMARGTFGPVITWVLVGFLIVLVVILIIFILRLNSFWNPI